ncbi:helix-turn-helix domain-containing protein [Dactylosporangium sp. AC04546]|uniref:helix-turn-helix domain-containing protein n=1 Tax=Dactylosporangium sp. AC04546 TaxID=2862460 RepID=UPI001EDD2003|nr:helix-turn-helix domain-containing protein [Dactylosporangium sp. AC04546]WVK88622.1 helix-turn-helix domain-containing protein [Dactylosporangium sp. AC04546]
MALLLDTSTLPEQDRADAVRTALSSQLQPVAVSVAEPARARISHWQLGPGVQLIHNVAGPHRLTCTSRHLHSGTPERLSLGLPVSGAVRMRHRDMPFGDRVGELQLTDLTSPYDFHVEDVSVVEAVFVDYDRLGLPVEAVRGAVPRLAASPMYELLRRHLLQLPGALEKLQPGTATALLGASTVELVRALIASVSAPDGPWLRDVSAGTLFTRLTAYIARHQREPDLGATRLAAEHGVSVRAVYAAFAERGEQLSEWVISGRLRGAHRELAESPAATVASIAQSWGFANARHFARRFRAEYGISPTEWQRGR